jgi:hypothetical protein
MATRNTPVLERIIAVLQLPSPEQALARLEEHFADTLLIVAGTTSKVAEFAQELRLRITPPERETVLDYLSRRKLLCMSIDTVEEAINRLFPGRFIEP